MSYFWAFFPATSDLSSRPRGVFTVLISICHTLFVTTLDGLGLVGTATDHNYIFPQTLSHYNLVDVSLSRSFEDRKFTIHHIAPLFMLYESTFGTLKFDWVEAHARSAKIMEITTDSGIVLVGLKGIRIGDDREIWQMEVSGSPSTPTFGGTKKSINTDILNLVSVLSSHLDLDVKIAKEIKVFSTQFKAHRLTFLAVDEPPTESMIEAAKIDYATRLFLHTQQQLQQVYSSPSEDKERKNNKGFAIFHDELVQQEAIMNKIDRILIPYAFVMF
ncbi:unnamed protein product [Rhizophagus irregularis]|nr:unnamed protein product [Rhizophagus irregularis]CAB4446299.1 unnamed protein product [Rhizophagus irregularis]